MTENELLVYIEAAKLKANMDGFKWGLIFGAIGGAVATIISGVGLII